MNCYKSENRNDSELKCLLIINGNTGNGNIDVIRISKLISYILANYTIIAINIYL